MIIFVLKPLGYRKLSHSIEVRNDALKHRESLKGFKDIYFIHLQNYQI